MLDRDEGTRPASVLRSPTAAFKPYREIPGAIP